jgi:hypothetical protein
MGERGRGEGGARGGAPVAGRALLPREHGAYAQLAFPLLTGLGYARFQPGAVAFAVAALALFLAHEPVAVLSGVRGARLRGELEEAARGRLAFLAAAAAVAAVAAVGLAPLRGWLGAAVPAALGALLLPLFGRRGIKSVTGETLVAAASASLVLPLALTGPVPAERAVLAAAVWLAVYVPSILAVHAVKARHRAKAERRWTLAATPVASAAIGVTGVALALLLPPWGRPALAVLPPVLATLVVGLALPHPRHLKRIGWTMVAAYAAALVLLLGL